MQGRCAAGAAASGSVPLPGVGPADPTRSPCPGHTRPHRVALHALLFSTRGDGERCPAAGTCILHTDDAPVTRLCIRMLRVDPAHPPVETRAAGPQELLVRGLGQAPARLLVPSEASQPSTPGRATGPPSPSALPTLDIAAVVTGVGWGDSPTAAPQRPGGAGPALPLLRGRRRATPRPPRCVGADPRLDPSLDPDGPWRSRSRRGSHPPRQHGGPGGRCAGQEPPLFPPADAAGSSLPPSTWATGTGSGKGREPAPRRQHEGVNSALTDTRTTAGTERRGTAAVSTSKTVPVSTRMS